MKEFEILQPSNNYRGSALSEGFGLSVYAAVKESRASRLRDRS
jgi:hypothetical protein